MNNYPYPVLTEYNSGYKENLFFLIKVVKTSVENDHINIDIKLDINSSTLLELLKNNKARLILRASTSLVNNYFDVLDIDIKQTLCVSINDAKTVDTISITALIIANEDILLCDSEEFDALFSGDDYSVREGDKLAISNEEKLSFRTENNNFIKLKVSDEVENGYLIRLSSENYIDVLINEDFAKAYKIVSKDKKTAKIIDSNIVFEILVYAILNIAQDQNEFKNKKSWYDSLSKMFDECGVNLEEFIEVIKQGDKLDVASIYNVVHNLINNQLIESVIKFGDAIRLLEDGD